MIVSVSSISTNVNHHECDWECKRARDRERERGREIQRAKNCMVWSVNPRIHPDAHIHSTEDMFVVRRVVTYVFAIIVCLFEKT